MCAIAEFATSTAVRLQLHDQDDLAIGLEDK
jgi:hypothetical protein